MAGGNDVVLLDGVLEGWTTTAPQALDEGELFELFCLEQLLKNYDLTTEELMAGRVGGGNDGGIDGFFTFINGELWDEDSEISSPRGEVVFDVYVLQARRTEAFQEAVFDAVDGTFANIFDLTVEPTALEPLYSKALLSRAILFREALVKNAARHPSITIHFVLATKGSTTNIHEKVGIRASQLQQQLEKQFRNCSASVELWGARELLDAAQRKPNYTLNLEFIESTISMPGSYIMLVNLRKYHDFITDESGALRKYIFEWNVRDYQGTVEVNMDIQRTLAAEEGPNFWWLNNGVTILVSKASITGKTMALDNVQIMNGMQTSVCIYESVRADDERTDERSLLCRVIETDDDGTRDRIIKATNFQTAVSAASLKATDQIQRDIEQYFTSHDWCYDRRKNYYKNLGRPADRIISIGYLAQAIMAIGLSRPDDSRARPTSLIKNDGDYRQVFDTRVKLPVYLWCAQTMKQVEAYLREHADTDLWELRFHVAMLASSKVTGKRIYHPSQLEESADNQLDPALIEKASAEIAAILPNYRTETDDARSVDRIAKSRDLVEFVLGQDS